MRDGWEILIGDGTMSNRGRRMLEALRDAAPAGSVVAKKYSGTARWLMMYGAGLEQRYRALGAHREAGGRSAVWDLGYWDRDDAMRLAIDSLHPTAKQLAFAPADGCRREHVLREDANPNGPIMLVGLGVKSCALYGLQPMQWETKKLNQLRRRFPGRRILWRPKGKHAAPVVDTEMSHGVPIDEALRGCSLVVCRHSNVGVDAVVAGVPVETDDGAALALFKNNPQPTREQRAEFLRQLGWWNWKPTEASGAWAWIERVINA